MPGRTAIQARGRPGGRARRAALPGPGNQRLEEHGPLAAIAFLRLGRQKRKLRDLFAQTVLELPDKAAMPVTHDEGRRAEIGQRHCRERRVFNPAAAAGQRGRHIERQTMLDQPPHRQQIQSRHCARI